MSEPRETPLSGVPGIAADVADRLRTRNWITTAEQLVAATATSTARRALADDLGLDERGIGDLIATAKASLRPERAAELERPVDPRDRGLGALPPRPEDDGP